MIIVNILGKNLRLICQKLSIIIKEIHKEVC